MNSRILYSLFFAAAGLAWGCAEELQPTPYPMSRLVSGENSKTWKIERFEYAVNDTVESRFMESCLLDDRFKFYDNTERLYETTSGRVQCFQDEPSMTTSTWTFTNAKATLTMAMPIFGDGTIPFFVRKLEADEMVLELFLDETNVESYRIYFSMTDEE